MCNCGGAGTVSNQTSNQLGGTTQQVPVPQPTPEQVAAARTSQDNALVNART